MLQSSGSEAFAASVCPSPPPALDEPEPDGRVSWFRTWRHPWPPVVLICGLIATAGLLWAHTRPSFDAFGWLVWGWQTTHGHLDLGGAPSWKPLPFLFTLPYGLFGSGAEMWLWMITDATVALLGAPVAGRIVYRLVRRDPAAGRVPAWIGAVFAAVAVLSLQDYAHYVLSVQSDPMIVTWVLVAIAAHLDHRPRGAFIALVLASLGRPEVFPFVGLYGLWGWFRVERMRALVVLGFAAIAFMWFGVPWITNGKPFVAGDLALNSPRELHHNRIAGTVSRWLGLEGVEVWLAALVGGGVALLRRESVLLALAAGSLVWLVVEVAFALHGWPALPRYLFEPAAVAACLGGVGLGRLVAEGRRLARAPGATVGALAAGVLLLALIPTDLHRASVERADLVHEHHRTDQILRLQTVLELAGGYRHVDFCGKPVVRVEFTSTLAFLTHLNVGFLGHIPIHELHLHHPIVLFTPLSDGGWSVLPWHTHVPRIRSCRPLRFSYASSGGRMVVVRRRA
jgi:hypothetical protein